MSAEQPSSFINPVCSAQPATPESCASDSAAVNPTPVVLQAVALQLGELGIHTVHEQLSAGERVRAAVATKSSDVDPVTAVDKAVEEALTAYIATHRPQDSLIGEEGATQQGQSGVTWIIDPIDGTVNFMYGIPMSAISVAAAVNGDVIAAAVVNIATGQRYCAAAGYGAAYSPSMTAPFVPMHANKPTSLGTALLATGFSYEAARRQRQAALLVECLGQVRDIRRMGSAALDLCQLAHGEVDCYYEHGLNAWDFAAGVLIAAEAGCRVWMPALSASAQQGLIVAAAASTIAEDFGAMLHTLGMEQPIPSEQN